MSASRKSIDETVEVLDLWRVSSGVTKSEILNLLERLARVKGNQSFRATTAMLLAAYRKEWSREVHPGSGSTATRGVVVRTPDGDVG